MYVSFLIIKPMSKDKLMVEAICNGTVLDHIPSDKLFQIVMLLGLDRATTAITIGNNLDSQRVGRKGVVKITDRYFSEEEISRIAILAPRVRLNIIRNYEVIEKKQVPLPIAVRGLVRCPNHKCITNAEPITTHFTVQEQEERVALRCHYCGRSVDGQDCEIL